MRNALVSAQLPAPNTAPPVYESDLNGSLLPAQNALERPLGALRRYKWLIVGIVILSAVAGFAGSRFVKAQYEARSTIWISSETPELRASGPIRTRELLQSGAWVELLRSYRVVDEVVRKLALYLEPLNPAHRQYFAGFTLADRFVPGRYELHIDRAKKTWVLRIKEDRVLPEGLISGEHGVATDSVGRKFGFKWALPPTAFAGVGSETVTFSVSTPRETSIRLADRLNNRLIQGSNFLWLTYTDPDPRLAALTLNTWADEYVRVAAELKKRNMVEFASILEGQLNYAEKATRDAEEAYQNFRVNAITLPTEGGPVAAGVVEREGDPALTSFFDQKIEYDNLRHDREALETNIANAARNGVPYEGLLLIPSVAQSPGAEALREAFRSRYQLQARLVAERQHFTDEYATVKELKGSLDVLEQRTIPELANHLLAQMREREADYQRRIQSASRELQSIPPRTIEEHRLNRAVVVAEGLYTNLRSRYAEAKLAEASATPDISVLDTAVVPLQPTKNTAAVIILMAIVAGFGVAGGLALLLDKLDGKFRYAYQAVAELGLVIATAVPRIPKNGAGTSKPEQVVQFLESFRTLRMHIAHSAPGDRLRLAVTSAAAGDGKSLISSNLALSYAEAGLRTVLVDGDTRRGSLHRIFGLPGKGGLTEYLLGKLDESQLVKDTSHNNLSLISCGHRNGINPELVASPRLKTLIDHLAQSFDVVIVDTPPLAAGIDAYALSAATGNVLMVLRIGHTERRLASAKLSLLDRLPVYVLGSVLNEVPTYGEFQYYTADSAGYALDDASSTRRLVEIGSH
jgi:capsular exopolysaccharide synthesis family protein